MRYRTLALLISFFRMKKPGEGKLVTTTIELAKELKVSQQSASRWLNEAAKEGLITKSRSKKGFEISLTDKADETIKELMRCLKPHLSSAAATAATTAGDGTAAEREKIQFTGTVIEGLGEGKYYTSVYSDQMEKLLGFKVFSGTLNLKASSEKDAEAMKLLCGMAKLEIPSFSQSGKNFCSVKCLPFEIGNVRAAIVFPAENKHQSGVLEIIAPVNLRKEFKLETGNKFEIAVPFR